MILHKLIWLKVLWVEQEDNLAILHKQLEVRPLREVKETSLKRVVATMMDALSFEVLTS
jgi:hypothetical protein